MATIKRCKACGNPLPLQQGRGRRLNYCPPPKGCKQRAYRQRHEFRNGDVLRNKLDLIYCAGDNERLTRMAYEAGFLIGIRSGRSAHGFPVQFVDIEYKRPNFERHLKTVERYRPKYATVPDLSDQYLRNREVSLSDIERALKQYEQLSNYCQIPLIVPKLPEQLPLIPQGIALGWSIRTSYGGVSEEMKPWHFEGRRIHLLGGSPHEQIDLYRKLSLCAEVMSADGNMAQLMATQWAKYWDSGVWVEHPQRGTNTPDIYLDCWQRSCEHIRAEWGKIVELHPGQLLLA